MGRFTITVGEVTFACTGARVTSELNQPDTASGIVGADELVDRGADWSRPAHAADDGYEMMHGRVIEAQPQDDGSVALSLRSALMLEESLMPPMVQELDAREIVYLAAREAGFAPGDINIEGLADATPHEPIWVLAPLGGLRVHQAVTVGVVEIVDGDTGREMLGRFNPPLAAQFTDPLEDVGCFARVAIGANFLHDAEREGLGLIDDAAAWLSTRLRHSWSHASDGGLEPFERAVTFVTVARLAGVGVFSLDGGRRWWRDTTVAQHERDVELGPGSRWLVPAMPTSVSPGDRQALLAIQRAITAHDPVQRLAALWDAIEFYLGDRSPEPQFTPDEITETVERASDGLSPGQAERVGNVLRQWLNSSSPVARLEYVLRDEGVPYTDDDMNVIRGLRQARNRAIHGAETAPTHEEVDQAVGLMSRAMTTRWSPPENYCAP